MFYHGLEHLGCSNDWTSEPVCERDDALLCIRYSLERQLDA
jgi:hypothetical protein